MKQSYYFLGSLFTYFLLPMLRAYAEAPAPITPTSAPLTPVAASTAAKPLPMPAPTAIPPKPATMEAAQPSTAAVKPYRTFITVQQYAIENNGDVNQPISNVRLEFKFPNKIEFLLPENDQYWPIGNGQVQEINRTYEVPWAFIQKDGFNFTIQMVRKGTKLLPCNFEVTQLSQFNRSYVCKTDVVWQTNQKIPEDKIDREALQVRVFTDLNSRPKEIPDNAIALRTSP